MTNWQERINAEINRRAIDASKPVQKTMSWEEKEKERRRIEADEAMRRLKPEELRALELLDGLGVKHMLEEIRDEVWGGHGTIGTQEFAGENVIYRRIHLVFKYKYPEPNWTYTYDKEFGFYKETYLSGSSGGSAGENGGGGASDSYSTATRFGLHEAKSGYRIIEGSAFHEAGEYLEVGIARNYSGFYLELPHYNKFKLNPQSLDEAGAKKIIEKNFLDDCIERKKISFYP